MAHGRILTFVFSVLWLATATTGRPSAAEQKHVPPQPASSLSSVQSAYVESRRAMLYRENFDKLDSEADLLLATKTRFPGGDWKLYRFFRAVGRPIGGYDILIDGSSSSSVANKVPTDLDKRAAESEWLRHLSALRHWRSSRPTSSTAILALAEALVDY